MNTPFKKPGTPALSDMFFYAVFMQWLAPERFNFTMAGLEPATQQPRVGAAKVSARLRDAAS
jgi:hypothetical protein